MSNQHNMEDKKIRNVAIMHIYPSSFYLFNVLHMFFKEVEFSNKEPTVSIQICCAKDIYGKGIHIYSKI